MRKSSNLVAYGLVGAVALGACNQLLSIEEPSRSSSMGNGGAGTLDGGGNAGSSPTIDVTSAGGDSGGASTSGGGGGADGDTSTGEGDTTTRETTSTTTSGGGSGGSSSMGGVNSTGGDSSWGGGSTGGTSTGGETSTGGGSSMGGATENTTASMTATTGVIDPPDPCAGEDLRGPLLVEITAGTGVIGNGVEEDNAFPIVHPEFDAFCIDETEVTVAQYDECVDEGECEPPRDDLPDRCPEANPRPDDHPVGCVDYERAAAYCEWAGKRLPTEKEWEYAARGAEGRLYPWGSAELANDRLNWNGIVGATAPVKSYPNGATPDGVYDMAGNVWEWTSSTWCSDYSSEPDECDPSVYVPRGGSYVSADRFVSPSYRDGDNEPDQRFGFRCAYGSGEK